MMNETDREKLCFVLQIQLQGQWKVYKVGNNQKPRTRRQLVQIAKQKLGHGVRWKITKGWTNNEKVETETTKTDGGNGRLGRHSSPESDQGAGEWKGMGRDKETTGYEGLSTEAVEGVFDGFYPTKSTGSGATPLQRITDEDEE